MGEASISARRLPSNRRNSLENNGPYHSAPITMLANAATTTAHQLTARYCITYLDSRGSAVPLRAASCPGPRGRLRTWRPALAGAGPLRW